MGRRETGTVLPGRVMIGFELYLKRNSKKMDEYLATFFTDGTHTSTARSRPSRQTPESVTAR
jgi:hypothetical protein